MQQTAGIADKLNEIRPRFLVQLLRRLDRFEEIRDQLVCRGNLDAQVEEIRLGVHRTIGLAGSLGFDDLGLLSRRVDTALATLGESGATVGPLPPELLDQFDDLLGEMALLVAT